MESKEDLEFLGSALRCYKYIEDNGILPTIHGKQKDIELYNWLNNLNTKEKIYHFHRLENNICTKLVFLIAKFDPNFFDEVEEKQENMAFLNIRELGWQVVSETEEEKEKIFGKSFSQDEIIWEELYNQYFLDSTSVDIDEFELFLEEAYAILGKEFVDVKVSNTPMLNTIDFKNDYEWNKLKKMFNISHISDDDINEENSENTESCSLFLATAYQIFDKEYIQKKLKQKRGFIEEDLNLILKYCNKEG